MLILSFESALGHAVHLGPLGALRIALGVIRDDATDYMFGHYGDQCWNLSGDRYLTMSCTDVSIALDCPQRGRRPLGAFATARFLDGRLLAADQVLILLSPSDLCWRQRPDEAPGWPDLLLKGGAL